MSPSKTARIVSFARPSSSERAKQCLQRRRYHIGAVGQHSDASSHVWIGFCIIILEYKFISYHSGPLCERYLQREAVCECNTHLCTPGNRRGPARLRRKKLPTARQGCSPRTGSSTHRSAYLAKHAMNYTVAKFYVWFAEG